MAVLNRKQILEAVDLPSETVAVPEWGGEVIVRGLTGAERDAFEASVVEIKGKKKSVNLANIRAKLVSLAVVGEDGEPIFKESDVPALGKKSAAALTRVFSVAQRLSGLGDDDVEELAKNS